MQSREPGEKPQEGGSLIVKTSQHFSKQRHQYSLAKSYLVLLLTVFYLWLVTRFFGFPCQLVLCSVFLFSVLGFLGSMAGNWCLQYSPAWTAFYPVGVDFSTLAELTWLFSSLSWDFCQVSLWPVHSALSVPAIRSTSFFPSFANRPQAWDHRSLSSPRLNKAILPTNNLCF